MNLYSDLAGWSSYDVFWLFWVRPGVGAWQALIADGGSADELAGTVYEFMVHVERMQPVSDSPSAPPGVQVGDFFLLMDYEAGFWIGDRVDVHLGEASGGGVIVGATMAGHEDDGKVTINLVRIDGTDSAASLRYETVDRTATAGVHYQASSGTAVFPPGHLFASFDVPVIDDDTDSGNKLFEVKLSEPSGTTIGRDTLLAGILDNDGTPYVILPEFSAPEADGGEQEIPIPVSLNHTTRKPVTVSWEIRGAGAVQSGVLEFAPGEKQKSVAARYVADDQWRGNRSFKIVVTDAVNAERGKDGRLIILEDDPPPAMTVSEATVRESDGVAILTLQLSEALPDRADTLYHTQDGSAKGPSDYVGDTKGKSCSIAAGVTTTTITIPIEDDAIAEETETFRVQVRALGTQDYVSATVTIVDDDVAVPSRRRSIRH